MNYVRFFVGLALPMLLIGFVQHDTHEPPVHLGGSFYLERRQDEFSVRSHGVIERTASGSKFYRLPQSDVEMYKRLRPEELKNEFPPVRTARDYNGQEVIGPYQVEGDRVWFGNQFLDSEGEHGVGAFGYFDMQTHQYRLFRPREIARWGTSALLVEPDAVWIALEIFGEDISASPGGLLRWDRNDHHIRHYPLEFVVDHFRRDTKDSSVLVLTTHGGYALFRNGEARRFRVEKSANGTETAVHIERFPPPPSLY